MSDFSSTNKTGSSLRPSVSNFSSTKQNSYLHLWIAILNTRQKKSTDESGSIVGVREMDRTDLTELETASLTYIGYILLERESNQQWHQTEADKGISEQTSWIESKDWVLRVCFGMMALISVLFVIDWTASLLWYIQAWTSAMSTHYLLTRHWVKMAIQTLLAWQAMLQ